MFNLRRKEIFFLGVTLFCALALGLEYLLGVFFSASLCGTQACEVAGDYIRLGAFNEDGLVLLGVFFFVVLSGLAWFSGRLRGYGWSVIWILLIGALGFDGALMGYQLTIPGPPCWLCVGVAAALLLVLVAASWNTGFWVAFVFGMAVWCGAFSANFVLDHAGEQTKIASIQDAAFATETLGDAKDDYHLFFSFDCPHCSEVLFNLAQAKPHGRWHFSCVDNDADARAKIAWTIEQVEKEDRGSYFDKLLQAKTADFKARDLAQAHHIPEKIKSATEEAMACFKAMDLAGVPTLVIKRQSGVQVNLPGSRNIARFFFERGNLETWSSY